MSEICFYLLGSPRLERDGKPVQVDTRKALAMLAYLTQAGSRHSRDSLAALLWPDYNQSHARAALRRTLSALHRGLGMPLVEAGREVLELSPSSGLWVDVEEFHASLKECGMHGHPASQVCEACLPSLERATELYQGHFMAGFTLRDSLEFDDWQFMQSESLRRELAGALERLVLGYGAQGSYEAAIRHAQRWLSLDPLHEPAHRQLMQLYALSDQRSAALRQYQECVRILDKDLGVRPLEETVDLYMDIKERRDVWGVEHRERIVGAGILLRGAESAPIPTEREEIDQAFHARLPLVGRQAEWDAIQQAYSAIKKEGFFLALEGEAGMGKTRLAEEFLADARRRGATIIQARCYPGETNLAFAPVVEGLSNAIDLPAQQDWYQGVPLHALSEAARLLPSINRLPIDLPPLPPAEGPGAQTRFFDGLSQVIFALCGKAQPDQRPLSHKSPGVLFIDDLEWADEATLDLLTYFVRRLHSRPVLVLVTWRAENLDPGHRLYQLLAESQRSGQGELISLSRLTSAAVVELIQASLPKSIRSAIDFSQRLYQETEGLPFFVAEYLATLSDVLPTEDWNIDEAWPIPHGMRDLLHSRMEHIGEAEVQLLQAAAVIGRSFDFETVREASGRSDDETITTLEKLMARGLIRESQAGNGASSIDSLRGLTYDFSHDKLRSLVYSETSLARRRLLHLRVAEALVAHARGRQDLSPLAGSIAHHYKQGGRVREAAEYYHLAGDYARSLYANAEALAHYTAALTLGYPYTAELNEDIGDMNTLLGDYSAALQSYETTMAYLTQDPAGTARLAHKLGNVHHRLGEWELAESDFQASLDAHGQEPAPGESARLYADWSRTAYQRGQMGRASDMAHQALDLAQEAADARALAQAHNILGILARSQGELKDAIAYLEQSLELAEGMDEPGARIAALNNLSLAWAEEGNLEGAIGAARRALELCLQIGDRHREAALHNNLADLYHASGKEEEAMSHLKQAVVIFSEVGGDRAGEVASRTHPEIWKMTEW